MRVVICEDSVFKLRFSEFVVCVYENGKHRIEGFDFGTKASASAGKYRDVMADVSVYAFHGKCIVFVAHIANMPPWIDNIHIA